MRNIGWSPADQATWATIQIIWEGTQRCLLEFLFGAGMMVLTARAMEPTGPVAIADLYYRRNLWLLAFGLFDVFVLLWPGDILHIYALAALFLFPFRKLGPKLLVGLGCGFALFTAIGGLTSYVPRVQLVAAVHAAEAKQAAHQPLVAADRTALADWQKRVAKIGKGIPDQKKHEAEEAKAHTGGIVAYATFLQGAWVHFIFGKGTTLMGVFEAFCAMLIGIALWKWGVIQGQRSTRFYAVLTLLAYGFGITARWIGVGEITTFAPIPKTIWMTSEFARLAVGLGHVGLVNLLVRSTVGRAIVLPFRAAGQVAFSAYFCEQIIGIQLLFAPYGLNLWGRWGWAGLAAVATGVIVVLLIAANLWVRAFAMGPFEWLWRSLAYVEWQPFRRRPNVAPLSTPEADAVVAISA